MSGQAKQARLQAELALSLQIGHLDAEINKEHINFRKVKVEMNNAENKMNILSISHANYCKLAGISASGDESLTYISPLSAKYHTKMDQAQEKIDGHADATGEEIRDELEDQIAKVKCDVECKLAYLHKTEQKEITPQLHEAAKKNQQLCESYMEAHNKILKDLLPCLTGTDRSDRKTAGSTWYSQQKLALEVAMSEIDAKAQAPPAPAPNTSQPINRQNSAAPQGAAAAVGATMQKAKLKPMDTPKWDGRHKTFAKFKKQWEELVHNQVVQAQEHHLLTTDALPKHILDNISTLSTTPEQIWDQLDKKFGNAKTVAKEITKEIEALDYKKLKNAFMPKLAVLVEDAYTSLEGLGQLEWLTSTRELSELEDRLPPEEKAEWAKLQNTLTGETNFDKFRRFLDHRKQILESVDQMGTRKSTPTPADKPDPKEDFCTYCRWKGHLQDKCKQKKKDDEEGTPGQRARGRGRGKGNESDPKY